MSYTKEDLEKILKEDFMEYDKAFVHGRLNDDAVDFSIVCHCLGLDPIAEVKKLVDSRGPEWKTVWDYLMKEDRVCLNHLDCIMEHMHRVQPYLDRWGEPGTMDAMVYCIGY